MRAVWATSFCLEVESSKLLIFFVMAAQKKAVLQQSFAHSDTRNLQMRYFSYTCYIGQWPAGLKLEHIHVRFECGPGDMAKHDHSATAKPVSLSALI